MSRAPAFSFLESASAQEADSGARRSGAGNKIGQLHSSGKQQITTSAARARLEHRATETDGRDRWSWSYEAIG